MKHHITSIYPRDRQVLTALNNVGYLDHDQIQTFLREKRISSYLKDGLIQRDYYSKAGSKADAKACYKLTKAGHELCRQKLGLEHTYHAQSPAHDLCLAEKYLSLSQEERATWLNESTVREQLEEQIRAHYDYETEDDLKSGKLSPPDAIYTAADGTEVAFEVITSNYSAEEIASKEDAAEYLDCQFVGVRV